VSARAKIKDDMTVRLIIGGVKIASNK
jgi:hypothetical protein